MTHDELLAIVSVSQAFLEEKEQFLLAKQMSALRAVVERHRESAEHKDIPAGICIECGEKYPCPTIEDITEELR